MIINSKISGILILTAMILLEVCQSFRVTDLRCGYVTEPLGIDHPHPRISWGIASDASFLQSAYRIEVASQQQLLEQGKADIWDSGKKRGEGGYRSVHGWIRVGWKREGKSIRLNLEIPANCKATVRCMKNRVIGSGKYEFQLQNI